ncbi:MAG: leucine-rich repeat domain-containing protein [Acidobacteria bacterium]|nr:leucine-rich repeat domain-containing protein [Acidobacteriota bacterium]
MAQDPNIAYRDAERKIEEARRSATTELDLSSDQVGSHKLTELPESLGRLTQLRSLDLTGNQLKELPESLGRLTQLEDLSISNNQLTALPAWFDQFTRLNALYLSSNLLTELPACLSGLTELKSLTFTNNQVKTLPEWLGKLSRLQDLSVGGNFLTSLPNSLTELTYLEELWLGHRGRSVQNSFKQIPTVVRHLRMLRVLGVSNCQVGELPDWLAELSALKILFCDDNRVTELPKSLAHLRLQKLSLENNPLNPELYAAYKEGLDAVKRYLRAKAEGGQIVLNEAKLILIGEGEVGKSCLLGALRGDKWEEGRPTTHGIEIKPVKVTDPESKKEITLNGWDFGGQRVYRPTHQLFFSSPAVYLVVWKPREGPQQGFVKDWIKLVKHREPDAKVIVVATHGGPKERQPDIDRQEIYDLFGRDMVLDFFLVESKPDDATGERANVEALKLAVARAAASLPEVGRSVPRRWDEVRRKLKGTDAAYMAIEKVLELCRERGMGEDEAKDFVRVSHRLGHLIHYEHDPALRDIVVLKPDWLSTAISFVLDDKQTRDAHGLVEFERLSQLWNDPARPPEARYDPTLHPLFLRLMERFDISYKVSVPSEPEDAISFWQRIGSAVKSAVGAARKLPRLNYTSLVAQLVPDIRPEQDLERVWRAEPADGDEQQVQICRIVDARNGQSANAEGLFYQLIVRLHKFSLGRVNYNDSVHWQRGLVLDYDYNGQALLEHIGNDVRITVRAPSPVTFLSILTHEVKWLVENFWEGLRCEVVVPCVEPCGLNEPGRGVFEVQKLIVFKRKGMTMFPCTVSACDQAQEIDCLLQNAPAARRTSIEQLVARGFDEVRSRLDVVRAQLNRQDRRGDERFRALDLNDRRIMSQVEDAFRGMMQAMVDEAREGPRLFSFEPVEPGFFDRPNWVGEKFRITLWCEHSRMPLPALNGEGDGRGVYELTLPREWVVKAAPWLKLLTGALSLIVPVAASATKLALDDASYKGIEEQLDLGQKSLDSVLKAGGEVGEWLGQGAAPDVERGGAVRAQGSTLRQLHAWLKEKDPGFGGLVRVQNKRQEFLWVHPQFEKEY